MIEIKIPGQNDIQIEHIVFDVNGTLAVDGNLIPEVPAFFETLGKKVKLHLLTADTHGKQAEIDQQLGLTAVRVRPGGEAEQKAAYVIKLGSDHTAAVGQGANDSLMLKEARIGICILSEEGTALETLLQADLVIPDIVSALTIINQPTRLIASLRK
jgi:P-type E1-E2 ATPase